MIIISFSCKKEFDEIFIEKPVSNLVLMLGTNYCKDCIIDFNDTFGMTELYYDISYVKSKYKFVNALNDSILNDLSNKNFNIIRSNRTKYQELFENFTTPFLIDLKNEKVYKYKDIFDNSGYVKKEFVMLVQSELL